MTRRRGEAKEEVIGDKRVGGFLQRMERTRHHFFLLFFAEFFSDARDEVSMDPHRNPFLGQGSGPGCSVAAVDASFHVPTGFLDMTIARHCLSRCATYNGYRGRWLLFLRFLSNQPWI